MARRPVRAGLGLALRPGGRVATLGGDHATFQHGNPPAPASIVPCQGGAAR